MTVPVAWRRAHPLGAMATLAGGALFNAIAVGSYVRCGAALPALALVVYSVGARCELRPAVRRGGAGGRLDGGAGSQRPAAEARLLGPAVAS